MKLTGKCLDAFCETKTVHESIDWETLPESCKNALIIDFFDSVGIFIGIVRFNVGSGYFESRIPYQGGIYFTSISRTEATNKAIEKANVIYNENKL